MSDVQVDGSQTLTAAVGRVFSDPEPSWQPPEKLHEMKRLLVDYLGVAIAGSRTESGQIAARFAGELGGTPQASVIGTGERVPAAHAAFANAIAQHGLELDDIDELALFHYAPPVMSATLAVAQLVGAAGKQVISAALSGCELMARLSRATNPDLRDRGFHTTPTCGVFGATVAAGRLMGLTGEQMTSALGLAGAQASGLMEMYGTSMQKRFNPGPAARNGIVAARMAQLGFTGADTILEGRRGFGLAYAGKLDSHPLTDGLGEDVPVIVEYKPYSCARPIHNAIDCAIELRPALQGRLDQIAGITMYRHPDWAEYHGISRPRTYHEAQMSLPYSVAVALVDGTALPAQYVDERVKNDDELMRLAGIVTILPDDSLSRGVSCRMEVELKDGERMVSVVDHPVGSVQNPLGDDRLVAKARALAGPFIGADAFTRLTELVWGIEGMESIESILAIATGTGVES